MDRRRFLAKLSALSAVGLAGCPGGSGGTDTPAETETSAATESPTPTGTPTPVPTAPPTATPTQAPTETPTDEPTETPTDEPTETATDEPRTVVESNLPRLGTEGTWIVDENGNRVVPRGVSTIEPWFADQYETGPDGDYQSILSLATDRDRAWYPNVIRLPLDERGYDNAGGLEAYAAEYVDPIVNHCAEQGIYVIVDHHLIEGYLTDAVDRKMREFWNVMAPRYADRSHVIYEIFNEPTEPTHYGNAELAWSKFKEAAQPWVDLVADHAPDTMQIVGSPRWSQMPHMAAQDPLEGDNLAYAGHFYPSHGAATEWTDVYGAAAEQAPVLMTEFGWSEADPADEVTHGSTSGWGEGFRALVESYPNLGWVGWAFSAGWKPAMFDEQWNLLGGEYFMGHFIKNWLWEKRDDHVPDALPTDGAGYNGPPDETAPAAPTGVETQGVSSQRFEVSWDRVVDDETSTQLYQVYLDGQATSLTGGSSMLLNGTPGEEYEVSVTAIDALSNESDRSATVTHQMEGELSVAAEIGQTATAPSIDGSVDDAWSAATTHEFQHVLQGSVDGDSDLGGTWRASWDSDALYLLVDVTDDAAASDSSADYQDDSVEVYVDADNSKNDSYDGTNDFQFTFPRNGDEISGQQPQSTENLEWTVADTDDGYHLEAAFPWSMLGVTPESGHVLGFDVHVNDDDDEGDRDAKISWFAEEDNAWQNPTLFANVGLTD